jgi:hypothetical protein
MAAFWLNYPPTRSNKQAAFFKDAKFLRTPDEVSLICGCSLDCHIRCQQTTCEKTVSDPPFSCFNPAP